MRAMVVTRHGGPEVLELRDEPSPPPAAGQLLVAVEAVGVNYRDIYEREGSYGAAPPFVAGIEGAGTVAAVADDVTGFSVGDRVAWSGAQGSYAELVVVDAARVVPVPDGVSSELAAAALLQGMTAHFLATSTYPVRPGDDVLVHAAAGGVGLLLTQIAKMRGGRVIGTTSSDEKAELARRAGADEVIGYDGFAEQVRALTDEGVAVVYDGVGKATFDGSLASVRPRGTLVLYGSASGAVPPLETMRLENQGSLFLTRPSLRHYTARRDELLERAADVFGWIRDGRLHIHVGGRYPLGEARRAQEDLAGRTSTGKLLLLPHFQRGARPSSRSSSRLAQEPSRASAARGIAKGSPLDRVSDEQLANCAARSTDRVEGFIARYAEKIRACAWRMVGDPNEIDGLTRETLLRLIRSLYSFTGRRAPRPWVYRIVHNSWATGSIGSSMRLYLGELNLSSPPERSNPNRTGG